MADLKGVKILDTARGQADCAVEERSVVRVEKLRSWFMRWGWTMLLVGWAWGLRC